MSPFQSKLFISYQYNYVTDTRTYESRPLPSDPFILEVPNSDILVRFFNYKELLPRDAVDQAIEAAYIDALYKPAGRMMTRRRIRYTDPELERVNLKITPRDMTWGDWGSAINALKTFMSRYEPRVLNFNIVDLGRGPASIGSGFFEDTSDDSDSDTLSQS